MICPKCQANFPEERFNCPNCGAEQVSKGGVKAILVIFWAFMIIWIFLVLQLECYSTPYGDDAVQLPQNVLWSIRCSELTCLLIGWGLYRYWQGKSFISAIILAFIYYLVTLWWIHNAFSVDNADAGRFFSEAHITLRGIFAFIATAFAFYVSRINFGDASSLSIGSLNAPLPNASQRQS